MKKDKLALFRLVFVFAFGAFLLLLPFQVWQRLFFTTQAAKVLFLGWSVIFFLMMFGGYYFFNGGLRKLNFTRIDVSLILLLFYTVCHIVWIKSVQLHPLFVFQWLSLTILYILFRIITFRYQLLLIIFLMVAAASQAVYGNLQLFGIYSSYHNFFKLTGSFFNPGPYSGYLISALPVAICIWLFNEKRSSSSDSIEKTNHDSRFCLRKNFVLGFISLQALAKCTAIVTIATILIVLPASRSRAAWLASGVSVLYLLAAKGEFRKLWQLLAGNGGRKWLFYILIAVTVLKFASGLYLMKKGSADGRILIWKVTLIAIKEQLLFGRGLETFKAFYMNGQSDYFKDHPDSPETAIAGDVNYTFNEPLRIVSETGLIGFLFVLFIICSAFKNVEADFNQHDHDHVTLFSRAGLLSIMIFSCFSYPTEIVPIIVNVLLYLSFISAGQRPLFILSFGSKHRNTFVRLLPAMALSVIVIFTSQQLYCVDRAYGQWNNAYVVYNMGAYKEAIDEYEKVYPQLKNNGDYLISYGKSLSMAENHEKAIEILERSKAFVNNTILYTALGDSYKAIGQTTKAENAYLHAWYMVPSRFYPKYLLAKLYDETGQNRKAMMTAKEILGKKIKVESIAIKEIKGEMKKIIEKQDSI